MFIKVVQLRLDKDREAHDEVEMEDVIAEVERRLRVNNTTLRDGTISLRKITRIAKKIHYSSPLRSALAQACVRSRCPKLIPPRHVVTRWNSLTRTLKVSIVIKPALSSLTSAGGNGLQTFALTVAEWSFVEEFTPVLDVCSLNILLYALIC